MKRRDIFVQILNEASGRPKDFVNDVLDAFLSASGAPHRYDEEISDAEYDSLLEGLRKEKEGIKAWLMKGNLDFVLRHGDPFGEA